MISPRKAWAGVAALALLSACAPRPESCGAVGSCGAVSVCVAARCVTGVAGDGGPPPTGLARSRRVVLNASAVALIAEGSSAPAGSLPVSTRLGRAGEGRSAVLLRYPVPPRLEVLAAYLLVDRADGADGAGPDGPGAGTALHGERVIGDWEPATASWRSGPELRDARAPSLVVRRGAPATLRVDVTPVVTAAAAAGEPPDHGIALVADRATESGVAVALAPDLAALVPGEADRTGVAATAPRLELYAK